MIFPTRATYLAYLECLCRSPPCGPFASLSPPLGPLPSKPQAFVELFPTTLIGICLKIGAWHLALILPLLGLAYHI